MWHNNNELTCILDVVSRMISQARLVIRASVLQWKLFSVCVLYWKLFSVRVLLSEEQ